MRCKRLKMEVDDARSQLLQEFKVCNPRVVFSCDRSFCRSSHPNVSRPHFGRASRHSLSRILTRCVFASQIMLFVVPKRIREMPLKQFRDEVRPSEGFTSCRVLSYRLSNSPPRAGSLRGSLAVA